MLLVNVKVISRTGTSTLQICDRTQPRDYNNIRSASLILTASRMLDRWNKSHGTLDVEPLLYSKKLW